MKYFMIPGDKDLEKYKEELVLPLLNYSIGFNVYFDKEEIINISKSRKVNVIINRLLHKEDIDSIKSVLDSLKDSVNLFFIEDLGLISMIDKDKIVLYQNHILNNYDAVNYFNSLGIKNVVINNDLTYKELEEIDKKTKSNIYYFYVSKNMIMYSRRYLVTSYQDHYKYDNSKKNYDLIEKLSNNVLEIKEEKYGSTVRNNSIFCASKYRNKLSKFHLIYDFSNIDDINEKMILENLDNEKLCNLIDSDYYFLENEIKYKVGDLK